MTETDLADEIVVIAGLATQDAKSAQYAFMLEGMREQGHDDAATRDFLTRDLDLPTPEAGPGRRGRRSSRQDMRVTMTDHLASLFGSAVGMLPSAPARSFEIFTEITNAGRIRLRRVGGPDPLRRHRPCHVVPRLVLALELRPTRRIRRDLDEQPQRQGADRRAIRRHHVSDQLAVGDHDGLRRARSRGRQLRRRDGGAWRTFRPPAPSIWCPG